MAEVVWTEPALNALDEIGDYIALDDHDAACRLIRKVFAKIDRLEENPTLGSKPKELKNTPYRRIVIHSINIYYRVEASKVVVIFVERSERDFKLSRITKALEGK